MPSAIVTGGAAFGTASSVEKRIGGDKFLDRLKVVWEDHQLCMGMMKDVLMYMVCDTPLLSCSFGNAAGILIVMWW